MAYSDDADLSGVMPLAQQYAVADPDDDPTTVYTQHRSWATAYIDNKLRGRTAVPVTAGDSTVDDTLAEAEALLIAQRLMKANFTQFGENTVSEQTFIQMKRDADKLLESVYFPASASTPAKLTSFAGNGTIAVTIRDQFAYTGDWVVKCTNPGTSGAVFRIWSNRGQVSERYWDYDLSTDSQWPSNLDFDNTSPEDMIKNVTITITAGATAFAQGDTWVFRTYTSYRPNRKGRLGWIPIQKVY